MAVDIYNVLKCSYVTEEAMALAENSVFTFVVAEKATKDLVARSVQRIFNVEVVAVNIARKPAKKKVFRGKKGVRAGFKKAFVRLKKGQKIEGWT